MSTPFLGMIILVPYNFAPRGWAFCNGQILSIQQNTALFSLLGTMYGGNGQTTFALPDMRGRTPIHVGQGFIQGQVVGQGFHTGTQSEMPRHTHLVNASGSQADSPFVQVTSPASQNVFGTVAGGIYGPLAG